MNKSLYRYFYKCFLTVLLIPTLILSITILLINSYLLLQNTQQVSQNIFSVLDKEFYNYVKQLNNCQVVFPHSLTLSAEDNSENQYQKFCFIQEMNDIKKILGFCTDIGYLDFNQQLILSAGGESSLSNYFSSSENLPDSSAFSTVDSSPVLFPYNSGFSTRFIYLYKANNQPDAYYFFTFDSHHFYNTVSTLLKNLDSTLILRNNESGQIFSFGSTDNFPSIVLPTDLTDSFTVNGRYCIYSHPLDSYDLSFCVLIPLRQLFKTLPLIIFISLLIISATVLIGLFMARHMAKINYVPIQELKDTIPSKLKDDSVNELSVIQHAIQNMNAELINLNQVFVINRENIKKSLLIKLLYQQYPTEDAFLQEANIIGIQHLYPFFTVCVLSCDCTSVPEGVYEFLNSQAHDYQLFVLNSSEKKQFTLIYNFSDKTQELSPLLQTLTKFLFEKFNIRTVIGVSYQYGAFCDISSLHESALNSVKYYFVKGKSSITFAEEISEIAKASSAKLPEFDIEILEKCILEHDEILLLNTLYKNFMEIQNSGCTMNQIKIYLFNMVTKIQKMITSMNIVNSQIFNTEIANTIMNSETLEDLFNSFYAIMIEMGEELYTVSDENKIELIQQYINEHFCDPDFSVNAISDHFHVSISILSRYYKTQQAENISSYINSLKLEKTKELLLTTDKTVEEIVSDIGYSNVSSFIRKFKSAEGVTPGQYRAAHKA